MRKINIKPLSANQMWQGRRYKTPAYKKYEKDMLLLLPKLKSPQGRLTLNIEVGFSSVKSDADNILKPFLDILQKKYKFNDCNVYRIVIDKAIVNRGEEYIKFEINEIN